jgi:hypothetical protein
LTRTSYSPDAFSMKTLSEVVPPAAEKSTSVPSSAS